MATIGSDRDGFAVVAHQHSLNRVPPIGLKRNPLADPEFEHVNVGAHLLQQAQALDDAVVEVDEFWLGQPVDIDHHGSPQRNLMRIHPMILGLKGCGELGAIVAPPAVRLAILDALYEFGTDGLQMPLISHHCIAQ